MISGKHLLAVVLLLALAVTSGLMALTRDTSSANGWTLLAIVQIVAAVIVIATAPKGTLASDEARLGYGNPDGRVWFHSLPPGKKNGGRRGDSWFVYRPGTDEVLAVFVHDGHDWVPEPTPIEV